MSGMKKYESCRKPLTFSRPFSSCEAVYIFVWCWCWCLVCQAAMHWPLLTSRATNWFQPAPDPGWCWCRPQSYLHLFSLQCEISLLAATALPTPKTPAGCDGRVPGGRDGDLLRRPPHRHPLLPLQVGQWPLGPQVERGRGRGVLECAQLRGGGGGGLGGGLSEILIFLMD